MRKYVIGPAPTLPPLPGIPPVSLSFSGITTSSITVSTIYGGVPTANFYVLEASRSLAGPYVEVNRSAGNVYVYSGLPASTTFYFRAYVLTSDGRTGMYSPNFSSSTTTAVLPGISWNPGHYMLSNFVLTPNNHGLPGAQTQLDLVGSTSNFKGYALQVAWGAIETALNTYDFSLVDPFFTSLKGYTNPKRFCIILSWATPFAVTTSSQGPTTGVWIPTYLTGDVGTYGAGQDGTHSGYWGNVSGTTISYAAAVHRAAVMARFKLLQAAVAAHFDSDPFFEGIMFQENSGTASNLQGAADWSWASLNTQYVSLGTAAVVSFGNSNVCVGNNFDQDRPTTASFMASATAASRVGYTGPDLWGATAESGHGTDSGNTWGQNVIKGRAWNGTAWVNSAGPIYKGKIPIMQMIQQPELDGSQFGSIGSPFTPADLIAAANALGATHTFWNYIASGTGNTAGQITAINSGPLTNTAYPTNDTTSGVGIKWHPGHYALSGQIITAANKGGAFTTLKAEMDLTLPNANVHGYFVNFMHAVFEDTTLGTFDFTLLDQVRAYIRDTYPTKRLGLSLGCTNFFNTNPAGYVPTYILNNPGTYGTGFDGTRGGYWQLGNYGAVELWSQPAVMARIIATATAIANHTSPYGSGAFTYDTDPYFEVISFTESALDWDGRPGLYATNAAALSAVQSAWNSIHSGFKTAFPHTNILAQDNYFPFGGAPDQVESINYEAAHGIAMGGPDIQPSITFAQNAYTGVTAGSTDQRGVIPYIAQVQYPDYPLWTQLSDIFALANGTFKATHIFWDIRQDATIGDWTSHVLPFINANPLSTTSCPSSYPSCNIS